MTKQEAVNLYINLNKLGNFSGAKFAYGVSKNINLLKVEVDALDKAFAPSEEYKKFDEERMVIVKKFAKKDEKGEPIVVNNNYEMEDQEAFDVEFNALKANNQEVWDSRVKQLKEYGQLLESDSEVVLYKIFLQDIPEVIKVNQMFGINAIVNESIESPYK